MLSDTGIEVPSNLESSSGSFEQLEVQVQPKRKKLKRVKKSPVVKDNSKLGYDKKLEISFLSILYSKTFREKLSDKSVLLLLKKGEGGVDLLTKEIGQISTGIKNHSEACLLAENEKFIVVLKALLRRWHKFNIKHYLEKECSIQAEVEMYPWKLLTNDKCVYTRKFLFDAVCAAPVMPTTSTDFCIEKSEFEDNNPISEGSPFMKVLKWLQVYRFIHSIIMQVIPVELFGSSYNRKCFKKAVKNLLMMGRYDILSLETVMLGVKISHCGWTADLKLFEQRSRVVAQVWMWLFMSFVLEILRSFFYITEGNYWKNQLFFFRKKDYQGLHDAECFKLLKSHTFHKIHEKHAKKIDKDFLDLLKKYKPASLRFIPKRNGMRAILPIKNGGLSRIELLNAKRLLNFITSKHYRGVQNVRSITKFQSSWINFCQSLEKDKVQSTYIVKVDIADAFGSIKQDVLIMLLSHIEKRLPAFVKFGRYMHRGRTRTSYHFIPLGEDNECLDTSREYPPHLISAGNPIRINVRETLRNVKNLVNGQFIKIGSKQRYLFMKGIAQGASLSSALCDLYYSSMCQKYLMRFTGQGRVLMRSVDDFIYVTPNKQQAKDFLEFMETGIEGYNCYINPDKTVHNLLEQHSRILFRGTLFCTQSKQLLVPVSSLSSFPPRYSIRLTKSSASGKFIVTRLNQIVKARLPPLLYHPSYVTIKALISNIWRTGILVGGRLPGLINVLILPTRSINPDFFCKSILGLGKKIWPKIQSLWITFSRELPISKNLFISVFIGGIFIMLGASGHPPLSSLKKKLRRKLQKLLREISIEERKLLPQYSGKLYTILSPIKKKVDK